MKLLELEIHNIRGITHLNLRPNGKNLVIWGPNGSGKSAVVDAIDFLLTGRVSRLTGKGTGCITQSKHGPHIDHDPIDAVARALVLLPGISHPVEIKRCMADSDELEIEESVKPYLEPIMNLANQGQHLLTRREVLRYVTSEPSTRAQQIQNLLNISEIEEVRRALVKVHNDFKKELEKAEHDVNTAKKAINETIDEMIFDQHKILIFVNNNRLILGGNQISTISSKDLKKELNPLVFFSENQGINTAQLDKEISKLKSLINPQSYDQISQYEDELRNLIKTIHSEPKLLRAISSSKLIQLGMELIQDSGECPLCETSWPPGKLLEHLEQRINLTHNAEQYHERISVLSQKIIAHISNTTSSIQQIQRIIKFANLDIENKKIQYWLDELKKHSNFLIDATENYPFDSISPDQIKKLFAPNYMENVLDHINSLVKEKCPTATPEQIALEKLSHLEENLKAFEKAKEKYDLEELNYHRAEKLAESFQQARDKILGSLYNEIRDRFVQLYRELHGADEERFTAIIEPEGAGLNFGVDFYGHGIHPPQALHSEGHQDSMGLCLYLALAERLTKGLIDIIILDDVMMSVDADHRKQACHILANFFPDKQFLITTHDKTWANQLKSEGVVDSQGLIEFYNWNVDTGPQVNYEVYFWDRIDRDLQKNDVPAASHRLRRGAEQFFSMACDSLQAKVTYKINGRWQLGDFLPAAISRYKDLLKKAKSAAQTWGYLEEFEMLQKLEDEAQQIIKCSNAEQWAINSSVHYNNWANLSEEDFRPVVETFHRLCNLFLCGSCGRMLQLATTGMTPVNVRCSCGKINWNLTKKNALR